MVRRCGPLAHLPAREDGELRGQNDDRRLVFGPPPFDGDQRTNAEAAPDDPISISRQHVRPQIEKHVIAGNLIEHEPVRISERYVEPRRRVVRRVRPRRVDEPRVLHGVRMRGRREHDVRSPPAQIDFELVIDGEAERRREDVHCLVTAIKPRGISEVAGEPPRYGAEKGRLGLEAGNEAGGGSEGQGQRPLGPDPEVVTDGSEVPIVDEPSRVGAAGSLEQLRASGKLETVRSLARLDAYLVLIRITGGKRVRARHEARFAEEKTVPHLLQIRFERRLDLCQRRRRDGFGFVANPVRKPSAAHEQRWRPRDQIDPFVDEALGLVPATLPQQDVEERGPRVDVAGMPEQDFAQGPRRFVPLALPRLDARPSEACLVVGRAPREKRRIERLRGGIIALRGAILGGLHDAIAPFARDGERCAFAHAGRRDTRRGKLDADDKPHAHGPQGAIEPMGAHHPLIEENGSCWRAEDGFRRKFELLPGGELPAPTILRATARCRASMRSLSRQVPPSNVAVHRRPRLHAQSALCAIRTRVTRGVLSLTLAAFLTLTACGVTPQPHMPSADPHRAAVAFLETTLSPWPEPNGAHVLVVTSRAQKRVAIYDNALVAMVLLRDGRFRDASRILTALAVLQQPDGSLPFSFVLPQPPDVAYVRAGAMAWVGYAAVEFADAGRDLPGRDAIVVMAHRVAAYLLAHRVHAADDPRRDLVLGGSGSFRYDVGPRGIEEIFVPGDIPWASIEHNIDAFFFLRALARLTGQTEYRAASDAIGRALGERTFLPAAGQLARGVQKDGVDRSLALDCASWGSLFLLASGRRLEAETAFAAADGRYASFAPHGTGQGHKPYVHAPLLENVALARHFSRELADNQWDKLDAVWPEGSAGVALAALRLGFRRRAVSILETLEPLRGADGSLPGLTAAIPFEFDTDPSIAGTAWVELVRFELGLPADKQRLWAAR